MLGISRMALLIPFFCVAYLAGVFGMIWFDLHVLGLGDPKFQTSVDFYFPLWSTFYTPVVVIALVFLWRSRQRGWRLWRVAGIYLLLTFIALECSFVFDIGWAVFIVEFALLTLLFYGIQKVSKRVGYA